MRQREGVGEGRFVTESAGEGRFVTESPGEGRFVTESPGEGRFVTESAGEGRFVTESPGEGRFVTESPGEGRFTPEERGGGRFGREGIDWVGLQDGLHRHTWAVAILAFGVGDTLTTGIGLGMDGVAESSPLPALLLEQYGFGALVVLKLLTLAAGYVLWKRTPDPHHLGVPLGLALVGVVVTAWNLHVILSAF